MSKQTVIKRVQESLKANDAMGNVTQKNISDIFDATFDVIGGLGEAESCRIRDFGVFTVKKREARKGNAVGTNAKGPITIPARLAMTFKVSKGFKEAIPQPEPPKAKKKAAKKKAAKKKKKK